MMNNDDDANQHRPVLPEPGLREGLTGPDAPSGCLMPAGYPNAIFLDGTEAR
jgi:hypothetical protein